MEAFGFLKNYGKFTPKYSFGGDSPLCNLTALINIRSYLYQISLCHNPEEGISQPPP
jgi:hypothetical protein